jgi:hypothetical protein
LRSPRGSARGALSPARGLRAALALGGSAVLAILILGGVRGALASSALTEGEAPRIALIELAAGPVDAPPSRAQPGPATFPDGAPARVTGGFGEDSCYVCHWNGPENDGVGSLRVLGLPDRYEAGRSYPLTLELERPGMNVAGFQMTIRTLADTTQAGTFHVPDGEGERLTVVTDRDVEFAQHLEGGTVLHAPGASRWTVKWTAPAHRGAVALHVAALAGDGDRSQMGDHVYTLEKVSRPKSP